LGPQAAVSEPIEFSGRILLSEPIKIPKPFKVVEGWRTLGRRSHQQTPPLGLDQSKRLTRSQRDSFE
jgi:hypothetical protein